MMLFKKDKPTEAEAADRPLIAIIDDEEDLCEMLRLTLEPRGFGVAMAHDGEAGLELIRARRPDLVVLDIKMPRVTGYQVLAQMQQSEELSRIPVFVVTSLTEGEEPTDAEWALKLNVQQFLSKPFDSMQLADLVAEHFDSENQ